MKYFIEICTTELVGPHITDTKDIVHYSCVVSAKSLKAAEAIGERLSKAAVDEIDIGDGPGVGVEEDNVGCEIQTLDEYVKRCERIAKELLGK